MKEVQDKKVKRIAYISFNDPYRSPGVYRKELNFCNAFGEICDKYGIEFKGFNIVFPKKNTATIKSSNYLQLIEIKPEKSKLLGNRLFNYILRNFLFINKANQLVKLYRPDVILLRYYSSRLFVPFNPKKSNKDAILISEHQAKEIEEMKTNPIDKLFVPIEFLKAKMFFKNVDGVIGVTKEIAEYELKRAKKNIPYFVLTNGIEVDKYPLKKYLPYNGKELNMLFVSSVTNIWAGLDRVLKGMYNYQGSINIRLHVVGEVTKEILNMINRLGLRDKVFLHGVKFGKELNEIFDISHIAIGSLGIHRKGLKYASTLKVREYTVRGIPFIISHIDEDIDDDFPFVFRVPDNDDPLNIEAVVNFVEIVYGKYKDFSMLMRKYALEKMDYKEKVKKLLEYIFYVWSTKKIGQESRC